MKTVMICVAVAAVAFYSGMVYWEWYSRKAGAKANEAKKMKCYCLGVQCNYKQCPVYEQCRRYRKVK